MTHTNARLAHPENSGIMELGSADLALVGGGFDLGGLPASTNVRDIGRGYGGCRGTWSSQFMSWVVW